MMSSTAEKNNMTQAQNKKNRSPVSTSKAPYAPHRHTQPASISPKRTAVCQRRAHAKLKAAAPAVKRILVGKSIRCQAYITTRLEQKRQTQLSKKYCSGASDAATVIPAQPVAVELSKSTPTEGSLNHALDMACLGIAPRKTKQTGVFCKLWWGSWERGARLNARQCTADPCQDCHPTA